MQPLQHSRLQPQITMELSNPWTVNSKFRSIIQPGPVASLAKEMTQRRIGVAAGPNPSAALPAATVDAHVRMPSHGLSFAIGPAGLQIPALCSTLAQVSMPRSGKSPAG